MSYYAQDESWKTQEICDIIDSQNSAQHGTAQQDLENYVIPGYHPSAIPHPEAAGLASWSSPAGGMLFNQSGEPQSQNGAGTPRYSHSGLEYASNPQMDASRFETDSSSSHSSMPGLFVPDNISNGSFTQHAPSISQTNSTTNFAQNVSMHSPPSAREKGKSKKPRGKVLNDVESELIEKDDALLTEEELAIKRKAQNRLAQRAFRERKESKLKDLQTKLLESEGERQRLLEHLEEIKSQFLSVKSENEVLRQGGTTPNGQNAAHASKFTFPPSQEAFVERMMQDNSHHVINADTVSKIYEEPQRPGQKVLAVGAVWDYLSLKIEEEEYENIDMIEVMNNLKGREVCHGYGPAYPLTVVDAALERVANASP